MTTTDRLYALAHLALEALIAELERVNNWAWKRRSDGAWERQTNKGAA